MSDLEKLGYEWHVSGHFLIRKVCRHCGEGFDLHALSNALTEQNIYGLCDACEALRQAERDLNLERVGSEKEK